MNRLGDFSFLSPEKVKDVEISCAWVVSRFSDFHSLALFAGSVEFFKTSEEYWLRAHKILWSLDKKYESMLEEGTITEHDYFTIMTEYDDFFYALECGKILIPDYIPKGLYTEVNYDKSWL